MSRERVETEVDGRSISLSNLAKVLYPETGFTKGDLLRYYADVAGVMLAHVEGRALTVKRYPDGVEGQSFFEKHAPSRMPSWVRTVTVPSAVGGRAPIEFAVVCDRPTLIWLANLAAIEFHVPLWRVGDGKELPKPPDLMVFDLDPGEGTSIVECCRVARFVVDRLGDEHLVAKTSGSKGLQLYRPLHGTSSEQARAEALELARAVEADHRELVVSNMRKDLRRGKVLIDWSQNHPAKTTVAAYSLRARPHPTVSTPVTFDEVDACAKSADPGRLSFEASEVLDRLSRLGDLMADTAGGDERPRRRSRAPRKEARLLR